MPGAAQNGNATLIEGDAIVATHNGVNNRINPTATLALGGASGAGTFTLMLIGAYGLLPSRKRQIKEAIFRLLFSASSATVQRSLERG